MIMGTPTMYIDLIEVQEKRKEPICLEIALLGSAPSTPHLLQHIISTLNISKLFVSSVLSRPYDSILMS